MNLTQFRSAVEVARQDFNLSRAARQLRASQPGLSRHLQQLEAELGVALFKRTTRRFTGLTPAGSALLPIVERVLDNVAQMQNLARDYASGAEGELVVATVYAHARYVLPDPVGQFVRDFPAVRLRLRQGTPAEIVAWVSSGEVDFSLTSHPGGATDEVAFHHCYDVHRVLIVPPRHPLTRKAKITLEDVVSYPLMTYDQLLSVWEEARLTLEKQGTPFNFVLSAVDADIMKSYVSAGLGVGLASSIAFDPERDRKLVVVDVRHLFPITKIHVAVRKNEAVSPHALHFIKLFAPKVHQDLAKATARLRANRRT